MAYIQMKRPYLPTTYHNFTNAMCLRPNDAFAAQGCIHDGTVAPIDGARNRFLLHFDGKHNCFKIYLGWPCLRGIQAHGSRQQDRAEMLSAPLSIVYLGSRTCAYAKNREFFHQSFNRNSTPLACARKSSHSNQTSTRFWGPPRSL
jgi:hypothetical protein